MASAKGWATSLKPAADNLQLRADALSITAGVLSVITGLGIYGSWTAGEAVSPLVKLIATATAIAAGVLAVIPRVKRYAERAQEVRALATRYGEILGELMDVHHLPGSTSKEVIEFQQRARVVMDKFQSIKSDKDRIPRICKSRPTEAERQL